MDACDDIMTKLKRPVGLVRYASLNELNGGQTQYWRPRTILYAALLGIGAVVATFSLSQVQKAGFKLTRQPGVELYTASSGAVTNIFRAKILNKQGHEVRFFVETEFSPVPITILNQSAGLVVPPESEVTLPLVIMVDRAHYNGEFNLTVRLRSEDGKTRLKQKLHFLGPEPAGPQPTKR
jgi:polyferredoxin